MNETIKPNKIFLKVKSNILIAVYSFSLQIIIQLYIFHVYNKSFLPLSTGFKHEQVIVFCKERQEGHKRSFSLHYQMFK